MTNFLKKNLVTKYFIECYKEMKKVVWPTKETTQKHTILVIVFSLAVALYFGVVDYILRNALDYFISL